MPHESFLMSEVSHFFNLGAVDASRVEAGPQHLANFLPHGLPDWPSTFDFLGRATFLHRLSRLLALYKRGCLGYS